MDIRDGGVGGPARCFWPNLIASRKPRFLTAAFFLSAWLAATSAATLTNAHQSEIFTLRGGRTIKR